MDRYFQYVKAPKGGLQEVRGPIAVPKTNRPLRRSTGEPNISGEWAPEQVVMRDPRGTGGGMVPLTQLNQAQPGQRPANAGGAGGAGGAAGARRGGGAPAGPRLYGGTELTELGEKAAADFKRDYNPRCHCETTSIVFDWNFDGPVNRITQNKDTIVLEYGQFGLKRTVYMNMKDHPQNLKPSRAGHSIGHWEGDTLIIDTVAFLPGFDYAGTQELEAARRRAGFTGSDQDGADAQLCCRRCRVLEGQIYGVRYRASGRCSIQSR
jgi:hypothetical protein